MKLPYFKTKRKKRKQPTGEISSSFPYCLRLAADPKRYVRFASFRLLMTVVLLGSVTFDLTANASCNYGSESDWQLNFASKFDVVFIGRVKSVEPPYDQDPSLPKTKDQALGTKVATVEVTERIKGDLHVGAEVMVKFSVGISPSPNLHASNGEWLFYSSFRDPYYSAGGCAVFPLARTRNTARAHTEKELKRLRERYQSNGRT